MRTLRLAAPLLGLGLVLSACGAGGATTGPAVAPSVAPSAEPSVAASAAPSEEASPAASASAPAAGGTSVALADTTLGNVLVDGAGMTLYIFTADAGGSSTCYDECATNWPALLADGAPTVGEGLDAADFGTTERTDGTTQLTFAGKPLYYFAGDTAPGDTKGQGLGGKWFVVDAQGAAIE